MSGLLFVWLLAAFGGAALGLLVFCLVRNLARGLVQAAFIDTDVTPKEMPATT